MKRITKTVVAAGAVVALAAVGAGAAVASSGGGGDTDIPITSRDELAKASAAALQHTGGGRVTGTEVGDEESYYEIEVTLADGSQVDVQLDRAFAVVSSAADHESSTDVGS